MKKLYTKINDLWMRFRQWGQSSMAGDITVSAVRVFFTAAIFLCLIYALFVVGPFKDDPLLEESPLSDSNEVVNENCTITGINLHGMILTYIPAHNESDTLFNYDSVSSEYVAEMIKQANENPNIKAIIIEADSRGGSPVAGEEISNAVKNSGKPVVALIRETGASAAYLAISSASKIFASKYSDIGSIGVTGSYLNNVAKNKKDGYTYEQLSAGRFKDSGSADKPLTQEEKELFMRDINIIYENFIKAVSQNRNISIDKVRGFADGSTVLGIKAKELGMIDEIGGISEVEQYLEGIISEKPEICWQ